MEIELKKSGSRCMGNCCQDIGLSVSPKELEKAYHFWLRRSQSGSKTCDITMADGDTDEIKRYHEIWLLYPMLEFIHKDKSHPESIFPGLADVYHYKCKNFDEKKKVCSIYEIRPMMCREFGTTERGCGYTKCKWKESRDRFKKNTLPDMKEELKDMKRKSTTEGN